MLLDYDALCQLLIDMIGLVNKDGNLAVNLEIAVIAQALKLKCNNSLDLDNTNVFVICAENRCNSWVVKKPHANIGKLCNRCKDRHGNIKQRAEQKETHKPKQVAADSSVPIQYLDSNKLTQHMEHIKYDRDILRHLKKQLSIVTKK